jgi:hypothetical protein
MHRKINHVLVALSSSFTLFIPFPKPRHNKIRRKRPLGQESLFLYMVFTGAAVPVREPQN